MHRFRFLRTEPEKTVPTDTGYDVYPKGQALMRYLLDTNTVSKCSLG